MIAYKKLLIATVCFSLLLLTAPLACTNDFTLEQVMSAPFPSDLIASPQGDKVAWVFYKEGKRNLWLAEAPAFRGRQLTRYGEDDGQEILQPLFSPDGNSIAYVRGGWPDEEGEVPNPSSNPLGAKQEVWVANTRTGQTTRIGEGASPFFSPAGDRVIFSRDGRFWATAVAGGRAKKLFEIRGDVDSPAWSPDGNRLAFVTTRGDHSFVGVYDSKASKIKFIEPSLDRDIAPRWSPDGKRIAFVRQFNVTDTFAAGRERITPWSIWVADAKSGRGKEIWKSGKTERDSFSQMFSDNILHWATNDRLVFESEKDGWAHLYAIAATGGEARALTSGNHEVENVAWSRDGSFAVIATNAGDTDRRHLWRVDLAGGRAEAITQGDSIDMYPVLVDGGGLIAFLRSTARDPLLPFVAAVDGSNPRPIAADALPANFPSARLAEPEQVVFKAADGLEIHGQLFKPADASGKAPAIVYMHGGPVRQMLLGWHYLFYYHNAYALNQYLASRGYMVLSVNFRAGVGYGRAFREAKNRGPRGASEYQDVVAAGKYLRSRSDVDANRIGLWGGSYGGFLTAMGLARDSELFAAGVDIHGVHDWSVRVSRAPWATRELIILALESSPINHADKWRSPVLFIHGDDDRAVAFSQTVELVKKLRERGVEFEQLIFPDEAHDFLRHESWLRAYGAAADFFDRKLK
ncbi:MAG: S9 family peptidase [Blastocatellia bacterium]|nr:S9 family peptidase [Blastocatellia bacterium]